MIRNSDEYKRGYQHGYNDGLLKGLEQLIRNEELSVRPMIIRKEDVSKEIWKQYTNKIDEKEEIKNE